MKLKNGILSSVTVSKFAVSQSKYNVIIILVYECSSYLLFKTSYVLYQITEDNKKKYRTKGIRNQG
jgi:hypothetical protein